MKRSSPVSSPGKTSTVITSTITYSITGSLFAAWINRSSAELTTVSTEVFASLQDGGFKNVLSENVREIRFAQIKGRPAMILKLHGSYCGKFGGAQCEKTLYWSGRVFTSAH